MKLIIKYTLIIIGILVAAAIVLLIAYNDRHIIDKHFTLFASYFFSDSENPRGEAAKLLAQIIGGTAIIWGVFVANKRAKAIEDGNEQTKESNELTKEANITLEKGNTAERFKNAIEHLGSGVPAIVLGGIYALHQIAKDNKEYRNQVLNILCSYIREKASYKYEPRIKSNPNPNPFSGTGNRGREFGEMRAYVKPKESTIVIQTIIDILFKDVSTRIIYKGFKATLSNVKLNNYDFNNCYFENVEISDSLFISAEFDFAIFKNVTLKRSDFFKASFLQANFEEVGIDHSRLVDSVFHQCKFYKSRINSSNFFGAGFILDESEELDVSGCYFGGATLSSSKLKSSSFQNCLFINAMMIRMICYDVNFHGSSFVAANLFKSFYWFSEFQNTNFQGSFLFHTDFLGSWIMSAKFQGAFIQDTKMNGIVLVDSNLQGACICASSFKSARLIRIKIGGVSETWERTFQEQVRGRQDKKAITDGIILGAIEFDLLEKVKEMLPNISFKELATRPTTADLFDKIETVQEDVDSETFSDKNSENMISEYEEELRLVNKTRIDSTEFHKKSPY